MRKVKRTSVGRQDLLRAIQNTYEDTRFLVGIGVAEDCDFFKGSQVNRSARYTKRELLEAIQNSSLQVFPTVPGFEDRIVISRNLYLGIRTVNESQIYPDTPDVDGFTHCICCYNAHYDIYYLFDHERKGITFALGDFRKTVPLVEHSGWSWKAMRNAVKCMSSDYLEQSFQDELWNPIAVRIGRYVLGIKPAI